MYAIRSYYDDAVEFVLHICLDVVGGLRKQAGQGSGKAAGFRSCGRMNIIRIRITSYNVCYTKLLRIPDRPGQTIGHMFEYRSVEPDGSGYHVDIPETDIDHAAVIIRYQRTTQINFVFK